MCYAPDFCHNHMPTLTLQLFAPQEVQLPCSCLKSATQSCSMSFANSTPYCSKTIEVAYFSQGKYQLQGKASIISHQLI